MRPMRVTGGPSPSAYTGTTVTWYSVSDSNGWSSRLLCPLGTVLYNTHTHLVHVQYTHTYSTRTHVHIQYTNALTHTCAQRTHTPSQTQIRTYIHIKYTHLHAHSHRNARKQTVTHECTDIHANIHTHTNTDYCLGHFRLTLRHIIAILIGIVRCVSQSVCYKKKDFH